MHEYQIVFLLYQIRSGSTFLSKLLDEYEEICVGLEGNLPDGIKRPELIVKSKDEVDGALDCLFQDEKVKEWKLNKDSIRKKMLKSEFPLHFKDWLPILLKSYSEKLCKKSNIFIYKDELYIRNIPKLQKDFPNAKYIYIYRDPRAIYNSASQITSARNPKSKMETNPLKLGISFNNNIKAWKRHSKNPNMFFAIKYEKLVLNPKSSIKNILKFLNAKNKKTTLTSSYSERIPEKQKNLHPIIDRDPDKSRINAWKNELSKSEILAVEIGAGHSMNQLDYKKIQKIQITNINTLLNLLIWLFKSLAVKLIKKETK